MSARQARRRDGATVSGRLFWFRCFVGDWMRLGAGLSLRAHGALFRLALVQWDRGLLPAEPAALRRLAGAEAAEWRHAWRELEPLLEKRVGGLVIALVDAERANAHDKHARAARGAAMTNSRRWGAGPHSDSHSDSPGVSLNGRESQSQSQSSSESHLQRITSLERPLPERWDLTPERAYLILQACPGAHPPTVFAEFEQWAVGKRSQNWDKALQTFARGHKVGDAERALAKNWFHPAAPRVGPAARRVNG